MKAAVIAASVGFLSMSVSSFAATLTYSLGTIYTGGTPAGAGPWAVFTFDDKNSNDYVDLTIKSQLVVDSGNFITETHFNVHPLPTDLTGLITGRSGTFNDPSIGFDLDQFSAQAGLRFDAQAGFSTPNAGRFDGNDSITIRLNSATTILTLSMFAALSTDSQGNTSSNPQYVAAHVQGIDGQPDSSSITGGPATAVAVAPLPAAAWAGMTLLGGMSFLRRKSAKAPA